MIKKINLFILLILFTTALHAQSKFGADSLACIENLSLFREYYKQKNYVDALNPWRWTFQNCPASSGNIYKNGPKIIKARMKIDKANKSAYVDTLMMIFDQRIKYFGKKGYVLGLKGYELIGVDQDRTEEGLDYLKQSLDLEGNNASVQAVYGYMKAMATLEKVGLKTKADVIEAYARVSEIIDYNIMRESKASNNFIKYSEKVEDLFTPYANCEDLIAMFSVEFNPATDDVPFLKRVTKLLADKECTESNLFFNASSRLYELEPSASLADKMAKMSIVKRKPTAALEFAKKAIELEEDANQKAIYYLGLADAYRNKGSYASARNAVNSALEIRRGWGEAYMNLGYIYVAGAKICGTDFEQKTVYWIAVDTFKKALSDKDTKKRAETSINTYEIYFPTTQSSFFNGVTEKGIQYTVSCWINKATTVRFSD